MNNRTPSQHEILAQTAEEDIPAGEVNLWPALRKALLAREITGRPGLSPLEERHSRAAITRRWQLLAALVVLLSLAILLATPPGIALARQVLGFFIPAKADSYPAPTAVLTVSALDGKVDSTPLPTPTPPYAEGCPQTDPRQHYACALAFAQQKIGFPLKALPADLPLKLSGMDLDAEDGAVSLFYGPDATIILTQRRSPFPQSIRKAEGDNGEVPAGAVQAVTVNGQPGEYVEGGFILKPGSLEYTWEPSLPMARLRWMDGETWFQMMKPGTPETLRALMGDKDSFIRLAERLVRVEAAAAP